MFWLFMTGKFPDGTTGVEKYATSFSTIKAATDKAIFLGLNSTYPWGVATNFIVKDDADVLVYIGVIS